MSMLIQHNMMAWNAERQFNTVTKAKNKKAEKLSSGYRINRAADDAAGLAISEKMRRQIRGLKVGTENAEMGISWVQIGEGALNEAHEILHRMNELSIKSQNGTNTLTDRAYMEAEFEQLQGELDRISTTTTFNELNIFEEHEPIYDQICGNKHWDYEEYHTITSANNQLTIAYRDRAESKAQVMTITVPPGQYTTHELIDEIDTAFGVDSPIHMEYTEKGFCRLNLEDGEVMDSVSGGLTYLLWDCYDGGGYGTLIGTTEFENETATLEVVKGQNDAMYVEWESFDPNVAAKGAWIYLVDQNEADGTSHDFTKAEIMQRINDEIAAKLSDTGLKASEHGLSIQLASPDGIVTGFKGNMFKIENEKPIYTSAFYDNIQPGYIWQDPASVVGGAVLTTDVRDEEHNRFYINSTNNKLVLQPNLTTTPVTITIPQKAANANDPTKEGYTAQEMVDELNKQFAAKGIDGEVQAYLVRSNSKVRDPYPDGKNPGGKTETTESVGDDDLIFEGIEIRTVKEGPDAIVNIDKDASTAYDTLFTTRIYNKYGTTANGWDATISSEDKVDDNGYSLGQSEISSSIRFTSANNKFDITLKSSSNRNSTTSSSNIDYEETFTIKIDTGSKSLDAIITAINNDLKNHKVVVGQDENGKNIEVGLDTKIKAEKDGKYIKIVDKEDLTLDDAEHPYLNWYTEIDVGAHESNAGYRILFQRPVQYEDPKTYTYKGSAQLTVPSGGLTGPITFYVNGVRHTIGSYGDSAADAKNDYYLETPKTFPTVESKSEDRPQNFTVSGKGTTTLTYWPGGSATGHAEPYQGSTRWKENTPATLAVGPATIPSKVTVDSSNNKITLGLNGKDYTFTLADSAGSAFDADGDGKYNQEELADALQAAIDAQAGTGFGGAVVEIKDGQFVITSRLGTKRSENGGNTSITSYALGERTNTFFESLGKTETAATCTSEMDVKSSISMTDGFDDTFEFSFTDKDGNSQDVKLDLIKGTESSPTDINSLISRITTRLQEEGLDGKVKVDKSGSKLVLSTIEKGEKTRIEYTTGPRGLTKDSAKAIFGDIDSSVQDPNATITLNQTVQSSPYGGNFTGEKTFIVNIDGRDETFYVQNWTSIDGLISQLNDGINGHDGLKAHGVTVTKSGSKLVLTRDIAGSVGGNATSLKMSYRSDATALEYIFGKEQASRADDVEIDANGSKLTITAIGADGKPDPNAVINITSNQSGGTLSGEKKIRYYDHVRHEGFHSAKFSTVTSVDLSDYVKAGGIELTRWNNKLEFEFTEDWAAATTSNPPKQPTWKKVSFRLAEGKTTIDDIVKALQAQIDAQLGKDKIEVLFDDKTNRLSLKSAKAGAQFQFRGMKSEASAGSTSLDATNKIGGGFFHHVMCKSEEQTPKPFEDPVDVNGDQFVGDNKGNPVKNGVVFAMGRHDVVFDRASLHPNRSDTLILDLNYLEDKDHDGFVDADKDKNGKLDSTEIKDVKTITLTLKLDTKIQDWIDSSDQEVLKTLREKINEAIKSKDAQDQAAALGVELHEGLIEVDIGRHNTGIIGNKDKVAISFTMTQNPDIAMPEEGYFYIDGIRGNAAYEVFYHTEGELIPAYITGTKDISGGVVLGKDDNELVFLLDGEIKKVDLSKLQKGKHYSAEEIVQAISDEFKAQNLPLAVSITQKGALKISYDRMGLHTIEQVTGSARDALFFTEHAAKRTSNERDIRVSSFEGDRLSVYSPRFSTSLLGINSICISTVKNAEKATNRLKEAIRKVSDMRSTFGAIQNRFEHTVNNNLNKHENLQAAESRIRDADISKEMVDFSNLSIIQQAGQAVLAQANQSRNAMLALLG